jgi:hypothetical protein
MTPVPAELCAILETAEKNPGDIPHAFWRQMNAEYDNAPAVSQDTTEGSTE